MRRGFTVLEVVVSLGLLAVIALGLVALFLSGQAAASTSRGATAAATVLSSQLTRLKLRDFSSLEGLISSPPPVTTVTADGTDFQVTVTAARLSTVPGDPDYRVLRLEARADWVEHGAEGKPHPAHLNLESQVSRNASY